MNELQTGIGTKEAISLKPLSVIIKSASIEVVGQKQAKKVVFSCQHPDTNDLIKISQVKWENKGKLEVSGLWWNLDDDKMIRKNSALAHFLQSNNVTNAEAMIGKSVPTILDDKNYLSFKGY